MCQIYSQAIYVCVTSVVSLRLSSLDGWMATEWGILGVALPLMQQYEWMTLYG